jgi:hypothetical protein
MWCWQGKYSSAAGPQHLRGCGNKMSLVCILAEPQIDTLGTSPPWSAKNVSAKATTGGRQLWPLCPMAFTAHHYLTPIALAQLPAASKLKVPAYKMLCN